MIIEVYFDKSLLMRYNNLQKDHNKIPKTFEILSTMIGCPKCNGDTLVDRIGYTPCIDSFCCHNWCHHSIEVKSILAEGRQKDAFTGDPFVVKVGSRITYERITKSNKSLMLFWYNILERKKDFVRIVIRNSITFNMENLREGVNCKKEIVLQKKKRSMKPRVNLKIFPESCKYKALLCKDFKYRVSLGSMRQRKAAIDSIVAKAVTSGNIRKTLVGKV